MTRLFILSWLFIGATTPIGTAAMATVAFQAAGVMKAAASATLALERIDPPVPAPDLYMRDADNKLVRLSEFRGRYVLLTFWATWCLPCIGEMPSLNRMQADLDEKDFKIVPLSLESGDQHKVKGFYREHDIDKLPIYVTEGYSEQEKYEVHGIPTSFLIDPQGKQVWQHVGEIDWDAAETRAFFKEYLKQPKQPK
ncbi:MAG: TlpA disulfide reductase family protein [Alphaproteobacteria bacterium]